MTAPIRPYGTGLLLVPELLVREVIMESLHELASDDFRLDEMFGRKDEALQNGTTESWLREMRRTFRTMIAEPSRGIGVGVGYPTEDAHLPFVSVIASGGSEDDGSATMGNVLGRHGEVLGDLATASGRAREHTAVGIDWRTTVQVGSWTTAPELSAVLHAAVKHLLFRHKGRLFVAGVLDVSLSDGGFEPDPRFHPRTAYVPVVSVRLSHTMVQTRRVDPVPTKITAAVGRFSV